MPCSDCRHWVTRVETIYEDGSTVVNKSAPEGLGDCDALSIATKPDFSCASLESEPGFSHVLATAKGGAPWQHWEMVDCPDCSGIGSNGGDSACHRCAGTRKVRRYDDGHVGEERTRLHPKEREIATKPTCAGCRREVDSEWVACPRCGQKLDAPSQPEKVVDPMFTAMRPIEPGDDPTAPVAD